MDLRRESRVDRSADDVDHLLKRELTVAARVDELLPVPLAPGARVEAKEGRRFHALRPSRVIEGGLGGRPGPVLRRTLSILTGMPNMTPT